MRGYRTRAAVTASALLALLAGCALLGRASARPVRAVVISDLNGSYGATTYGAEVGAAVRHIVDDWRPDVVLIAGDMVAGQAPQLADSAVRAMWRAFDSVVAAPLRAAGIPVIPTLGNHDGSAYPAHARDRRIAAEYWRGAPRVAGRGVAVDAADFPLRHAFAVGGLYVASWDATNQESGANDELTRWLERSLASEPARRARHRLVLGHLPLYGVAEGRNRAGEVLAQGDSLRRRLERWGATMYVSGHHHAYYPARRGAMGLLHAGALGGGPRPLLGSVAPSPRTITVLDVLADSIALSTFAIDSAGGLAPVPMASLPVALCGINGGVVRRDLPDRVFACP